MKILTKKREEQERKKQEGLFQSIIERTSKECKDWDNEPYYMEVIMQLAPYLFPNEKDAIQARGRMLRALNQARKRDRQSVEWNGADGRTNGYV